LRLAGALYELGVRSGEIVSYQLPNWVEANLLDLARAHLGAVSNPIMHLFRAHELRGVLSRTHSRVFVVAHKFRGFDYTAIVPEVLAEAPSVKHVFVVGGNVASYRRFSELISHRWEATYPRDFFAPFRAPQMTLR